jgi:hypothetical protein
MTLGTRFRAGALSLSFLMTIAAVSGVAPIASNAQTQPQSGTFPFTGTLQTYTVPAGVTSLTVTGVGSSGGASPFN